VTPRACPPAIPGLRGDDEAPEARRPSRDRVTHLGFNLQFPLDQWGEAIQLVDRFDDWRLLSEVRGDRQELESRG
jgi:hypothetical protein